MDRKKQKRHEALDALTLLSKDKGYLLFEDIMNSADEYDLSIPDVDWLSSAITTQGILVYDAAPTSNITNDTDEYDDFAQVDYEAIFNRVVELSSLLEPFINDVRGIIPPQYHEVTALKYQVAEGNEYARKRMIEMNLRVAIRIALNRAEKFDLDIEETIGDACIGLINAVDKYDPDTSEAFSSYASFWIFQNITREQGTCRPLIYYPMHKKEVFYTMYPIFKEYGCLDCQEWYGCSKVKNMIYERIQCTEEEIDDVISACTPIESLDLLSENVDTCCEEEENFDLEHLREISFSYSENIFDDNIDRELLQKNVHKIIESLVVRERKVICARYGLDDGRTKTLEEIGQNYGVSRERIRQIEMKAMKHLSRLVKRAKIIEDT